MLLSIKQTTVYGNNIKMHTKIQAPFKYIYCHFTMYLYSSIMCDN